MRIPSSRVRRSTSSDSTPYSPASASTSDSQPRSPAAAAPTLSTRVRPPPSVDAGAASITARSGSTRLTTRLSWIDERRRVAGRPHRDRRRRLVVLTPRQVQEPAAAIADIAGIGFSSDPDHRDGLNGWHRLPGNLVRTAEISDVRLPHRSERGFATGARSRPPLSPKRPCRDRRIDGPAGSRRPTCQTPREY